jgi:DNA-binding transcriptional LysR family regulator
MEFNQFDLNLLKVFDALYTHRNASAAAVALGVTQPAVSNALRRLRDEVSDELFTRTPTGMAPTPFGDTLAAEVAPTLARLREGLARPDAFEAASSERRFTIAMSDVGEIVFLPKLIEALHTHAPKVTLTTVSRPARNLKLDMENGTVDLAVGFLPDLKANFYQQRMFSQRYVVMMREQHPLAAKPLTAQGFRHARHALVEAEGTGHGVVQTALQREGLEDAVALTLPHFLAVPMVIESSDLIVTVPEKLGQAFARVLKVQLAEHPLSIAPFQVNQYWHRRYHKDPANKWLRGLFAALFKE